jgi:hypothetical protein
MKCALHPEVDSTGYCRQCGKGLCSACRRDVRGAIYCEDCLAANVLGAPAAAAPPPGAPNPGLALALGFIPGVGAIYNGDYLKAFIFILAFGGLISVMDTEAASGLEPLLGMMLFGFYVFMVIDSYRTAKQRATGAAPASTGLEPLGLGSESATPIGPLILIVLGALFLLNTLDFFPLRFLWKFWPAILIAIGVWMLWQRSGGERREGRGGE